MDTKKDIRKRIIKERSEQDPVTWKSHTDEIVKKVTGMNLFREATDIYCYMDFGGEVGTRDLIQEAWKLGKTVWIPRIDGDNMDFFEITSFDELHQGTFGVMEPNGENRADGEDGLVIVPGVAFDRDRNRIGFGKGYYDKYLSAHKRLRTIAVAFKLQIVDKVPAEEMDIRPEMLVTEDVVYKK